MSMVTYPLNNIEYTAEDAELFHSTRTSGVYATNSFDYSVTGADNTIIIGTGIAWIKNSEFSGKVVAQKESISLDMGLPDSVYPRIDAIVIQFDANKNASEILVKEGVASSNPTPPNVVRTESIYELHIYHVRRYAGSLTISPDSISDLRTNSNYCGLMYDSVTQAVDATLSKSGIAADAEAVGKRISNLKATDVGAVSKTGDTMTGSLKINGSWKGISFDENASILNAGARLTFDQRPQNSTGSFERYILPTPTERTGDVWYSIFTAKNIGEISSTASASNNYHTAHFAKIGKTVICTLLPKALGSTVQYEETITIPTGYSPSAQTSFPFFSDTAKNAGDSTGKVAITANTNGSLYISASHGFTLAEVSKTICWVTA